MPDISEWALSVGLVSAGMAVFALPALFAPPLWPLLVVALAEGAVLLLLVQQGASASTVLDAGMAQFAAGLGAAGLVLGALGSAVKNAMDGPAGRRGRLVVNLIVLLVLVLVPVSLLSDS